MIRDKISFYNHYDDLSTTCLSFKKKNHRLNQCPFLNIKNIYNPRLVIRKYIYSKPQTRIEFKRNPPTANGMRNTSALLNRKKIMKKAINVRFNKDLMNNFQESINKSKSEKIDIASENDSCPTYRSCEKTCPQFKNKNSSFDFNETFELQTKRRYKSLEILLFGDSPKKKNMSVSFEKLSDVGDVSPPIKNPLRDSSLTDPHKTLAEIHENFENNEEKKLVDFCNEVSPRNFGEFMAQEISNRKKKNFGTH